MPEQAHETVTEQAHGPIFEQAHGPMFEQAHRLETDQLGETREHVRAVLYEKLLSLGPQAGPRDARESPEGMHLA